MNILRSDLVPGRHSDATLQCPPEALHDPPAIFVCLQPLLVEAFDREGHGDAVGGVQHGPLLGQALRRLLRREFGLGLTETGELAVEGGERAYDPRCAELAPEPLLLLMCRSLELCLPPPCPVTAHLRTTSRLDLRGCPHPLLMKPLASHLLNHLGLFELRADQDFAGKAQLLQRFIVLEDDLRDGGSGHVGVAAAAPEHRTSSTRRPAQANAAAVAGAKARRASGLVVLLHATVLGNRGKEFGGGCHQHLRS
mmetsp:Transcript_77511/g.250911  ORF Transcript_77511/g.250911 Transcript_77511/m.250911 type:complete len:253 (-) Transcript_77511:696-1454(-)